MRRRAVSRLTDTMRGCSRWPTQRRFVPNKHFSTRHTTRQNRPSRIATRRSFPNDRLPSDMTSPPPRIARLSLDELCAAYHNEDVHTEHVTALALRLFDRTRAWLDLPMSGRQLLDAAARLHDVGYSIDPVHHMHAS